MYSVFTKVIIRDGSDILMHVYFILVGAVENIFGKKKSLAILDCKALGK
jgi:hypothetical protein